MASSKARLRPMRSLSRPKRQVVIAGHAFVQNIRSRHYELGVDGPAKRLRVSEAFTELARAI